MNESSLASAISIKRTTENRMSERYILPHPQETAFHQPKCFVPHAIPFFPVCCGKPQNYRKLAYLRSMIRTTQLHELIEFFHAFVGFCVDPSSLLSPLSKYRISLNSLLTSQRRSRSHFGYSHEFCNHFSFKRVVILHESLILFRTIAI